jgi:hypothetical protein
VDARCVEELCRAGYAWWGSSEGQQRCVQGTGSALCAAALTCCRQGVVALLRWQVIAEFEE